jgi:predicted DNA binding CopG/RHH family protein
MKKNIKKTTKKSSLDKYEQAIEDSLDLKNLKSPSRAFRAKVRSAAKATLKENKVARANIRMNESDLEAIQAMAVSSGMPYQTLINHIIHLYVTGQLIHTQEVRKLIDAGVFEQSGKRGQGRS